MALNKLFQHAHSLTAAVSPTTMFATPSMSLRQNQEGEPVVGVRRKTQFAEMLTSADLTGIRDLARRITERMELMSQGPYSLAMLRAAGHPYGLGRRVPSRLRGRYIGQVRGVRGRVPSMTVINRQTGNLARSWRWSVQQDEAGIMIEIRNEAKTPEGVPYPWFLAAGTPTMQAHGPFTYVPRQFEREINAEWTRVTTRLYRRSLIDNLLLSKLPR